MFPPGLSKLGFHVPFTRILAAKDWGTWLNAAVFVLARIKSQLITSPAASLPGIFAKCTFYGCFCNSS